MFDVQNILLALVTLIFISIFVVVVTYTILKHHLFNIKVIATELLTFSLWIFILVRTLLADSVEEVVINGGLLIAVVILGIFLIRGVLEEVRTRERVERLAKDLAVANKRLKELNQRKSEFVSLVSHQLRSPLTAIKGYASMLLEGSFGKLPDKARGAIDRVFQSSDRLVDIIEDFLTISRIEQNRLKYEFRTVSLREVVENIINEMKPTVKSKGLDILFKVKDDEDYNVTADPGKMGQVVGNIIDNAIKYTPDGSITISLSRDPKKRTILLSVADTGIGISKEAIDKIFQKFSRAKGASKISVDGVGLGLYVADQIVKAHHGRIWAKSAGEGKGSTVYIELPAED